MEGNQFQEAKHEISKNEYSPSIFNIGEYSIVKRFFDKYNYHNNSSDFYKFEFMLNSKILDTGTLKKYINSLYKTQFIDKVQSTYTLLKADKREVSLKDIKRLIVTNPFTDGLKTLILAIKDDKNCSKEMYEGAIRKLYHIRYYHTEAILLYCQYLKDIDNVEYKIWFKKGIELAKNHYYRYLEHAFNCLDSGIHTDYNENDYPLPEKLDYAGVIKEYDL